MFTVFRNILCRNAKQLRRGYSQSLGEAQLDTYSKGFKVNQKNWNWGSSQRRKWVQATDDSAMNIVSWFLGGNNTKWPVTQTACYTEDQPKDSYSRRSQTAGEDARRSQRSKALVCVWMLAVKSFHRLDRAVKLLLWSQRRQSCSRPRAGLSSLQKPQMYRLDRSVQ